MAEVLDLVQLSVWDRPDPEEVDDDRNAAFPPSSALANEAKNSAAGGLDELKRLPDQVDPPVPICSVNARSSATPRRCCGVSGYVC